jgi:hypothetical protein
LIQIKSAHIAVAGRFARHSDAYDRELAANNDRVGDLL